MKTPRPRPVNTSLTLTADLEGLVAGAEAAGCTALWDRDAGTVEVFDDGAKVLAAIQKGRNQPWIAMFYNAGRITWSTPE